MILLSPLWMRREESRFYLLVFCLVGAFQTYFPISSETCVSGYSLLLLDAAESTMMVALSSTISR